MRNNSYGDTSGLLAGSPPSGGSQWLSSNEVLAALQAQQRASLHLQAQNTAMQAAFLMQQMEWREALDEAQGDVNGLTQLADDTNAAKKTYLQLAELAFDTDKDIPRAVGAIRALMFIERFLKDVNQQLDALTP